MTNTSEAPKWIVLIRNVLISAASGTFFGCLLFPWYGAILQAIEHDTYSNFDFKSLLISTLNSPLLIFVIFPILLPLISTACLAGVVFQKSIEKHLKLWCIVSPIAVWLTTIIILIQMAPNLYYEKITKLERLLIEISNPDHFLYLITASFSSFVFYRLSKKGFRW